MAKSDYWLSQMSTVATPLSQLAGVCKGQWALHDPLDLWETLSPQQAARRLA